MPWRRRRLSEQDLNVAVDAAVKSAVADVTTATLLATHIAQCEKDKQALKDALAVQNADRERMHVENAAKFDKLNRMVWMAAGGLAVLSGLMKVMH